MPEIPDASLTTTGVIKALYNSGKVIQKWGKAVDGTPLLSGSTGAGTGSPILITAGVHASEVAGVCAALNLMNLLEADHEVIIFPLRDPFGFAGVNHCLSYAAQQPVHFASHGETLEYLKQYAMLLWHLEDTHIFLLNKVGFIWSPLQRDGIYQKIEQVDQLSHSNPEALKPLWGKSLMLLSPDAGCDGSAEMQRCWHGVFSEQGEWLHLNRFFRRSNSPPEVAALCHLIQSTQPELICDLQEDRVNGFWLGIPRSKKASEHLFLTASAFIAALHEKGAPILTYEGMLASEHVDTAIPGLLTPEARLPGMNWMDILPLGEGHNLLTYAATISTGFGVEAPMQQPLAMRVEGITCGMLAAIREWETLGN